MNTEKYYRPEVEVLVFSAECGFAASQGGAEKGYDDQGDLESPEFEIW